MIATIIPLNRSGDLGMYLYVYLLPDEPKLANSNGDSPDSEKVVLRKHAL